jgi:hypothetical protein
MFRDWGVPEALCGGIVVGFLVGVIWGVILTPSPSIWLETAPTGDFKGCLDEFVMDRE